MTETCSNGFLVTEKPGKLMCRYSIPCIISLVVAALYNIVDQIYIANADYLGSYGNAANTTVFPMTVLALAIAVMLGDGACAFVSICLGSRNQEAAGKTIGNAVLLTIISSAIITLLYLVFAQPFLTIFGGHVNTETFTLSREYFFWISLGIPFYMFGQAMNPIIRSDGSPRFAMLCTVAGAVVNIILDWLFIYPLHLGMQGAALATVLGQILTAILSAWYLMHLKSVHLHKRSFGIFPTLMHRYLPLGITSFLSQASLVVSMAAVQNTCTKYSALDPVFSQTGYTQIPLAVLGIVMKFFQIAISVSVGLSAGCIPVVGYNIGAGRKDRIMQFFTYLLASEAILGTIALFIVEFFPLVLISIFGAANESHFYTEFAIRCFRIYLCMMPLAMINKGTFIFLQSLGRGTESMILSMLREIVFGVLLPVCLPLIFGLSGLLYSFPTADALTFILSLMIIIRTYKQLKAA
ncbi:MAG: polysaccharide biosynthesis C-terminal domain-containing protein [Clostridiales bacterium]|nr:polysaccharide biosynthesis C-terminal domain-containing protein [Clostridiales bacterium]